MWSFRVAKINVMLLCWRIICLGSLEWSAQVINRVPTTSYANNVSIDLLVEIKKRVNNNAFTGDILIKDAPITFLTFRRLYGNPCPTWTTRPSLGALKLREELNQCWSEPANVGNSLQKALQLLNCLGKFPVLGTFVIGSKVDSLFLDYESQELNWRNAKSIH